MYNKFKDCLIKPSKIYKYVDQKFGKKLLYFLLLVLIYVLPNIMTLTTFNGLNQNQQDSITNSFASSETINYALVKNEDSSITLEMTKNNATPQYVYVKDFNGSSFVMLFSNEEIALTEYQLPNEMVGKSLIFLQFTKDHARLFVSTYEGKKYHFDDGKQNVASLKMNYQAMKITYDKLGAVPIDFGGVSSNKTSFARKINELVVSCYNKNKTLILLTTCPITYLVGIINFLLEALIFAVVVKLLYYKMGLPFKKIFSLIVLTYTPRVVFNVLSIFWSSAIIYILGEVISVIYLLIAIRYYALQQLANSITNNKDNK